MVVTDRRAGRPHGRLLSSFAARCLWRRLVASDSDAGALVFPSGLAHTLQRSWQRLHQFRVPLEALLQVPTPESAAFHRLATRYAAILTEQGWLDAAQAPDVVASAAAPRALELHGFDEQTPQQQAFFERMVRDGVDVTSIAPPYTRGRACVVTCQDAAAELDAATRWAAARLTTSPETRCAIAVPGLADNRALVRRTLDAILDPGTEVCGGPRPESLRYQLVAADPLAAQPVVSAALDLLECFTKGVEPVSVARLLGNGFCAGAEEERHARSRLAAWLQRRGVSRLPLAAIRAVARERGCPQLAQAMSETQSALENWPHKETASSWSQRFSELLATLGWPHVRLDSRAFQARERWLRLIGEFGASEDFFGALSARSALAELRRFATDTGFQPQSTAASLLVADPDTCVGMQFDALWVCGLDDAHWPAPANPDPFLPVSLQVERGVPGANAASAERHARKLIERLRASAPDVVFSVPSFDGDAELLPSPLLSGVDEATDLDRWPGATVTEAQYRARPRLEVVSDGALPPASGEERTGGGARLLQLQSDCPFRAQAEVRLGAVAPPIDEPGLTSAQRGTLVHDALARLWNGLETQAALRLLDADERSATIASVVDAAIAALRTGPRDAVLERLLDIERRWLCDRIAELLELDVTRTPFAIESCEHETPLEIGTLRLTLRTDRVDRLEDGRVLVIDYKTGESARPRAWFGERPALPQVPAYVLALDPERVAGAAFARLSASGVEYAGVSDDDLGVEGVKPHAPKHGGTWQALVDEWRARLTALADEFARGDARLAPDPARACRYCHLPTLCRIDESRSDREGDAPAESSEDE